MTNARPPIPAPPTTTSDRLLDEGILPLVVAAEAEGLGVTFRTLLRWVVHGVRGVRLETIRVGGRRLTSRAAIRRFVAAQQHDAPPAAQCLDARAAEQVLAAHGLGRREGSR